MTFEAICLKIVVYRAYMAGTSPQVIARKLKKPVGTIRKWIAEVAHATTGTNLPIDKIREITRRVRS